MKYGLGWTNAIWDWYNKVWKKQVRDKRGSNPIEQIGGVIATFLAMIVMIIGVIIGGIVDTVVEFVNWFGGLFNDTDDDIARATIRDMSCNQINALSDQHLNEMTESLLDGFTGDDDEDALIKIVECLNCDRLTGEYWTRYGSRIQSNIHGSEYDRLRVAMRRCLLVNFSDWDDDATRVFISNSSCFNLQLLTLTEIKQLLRNMFSGTTGNADERMINRLIGCLGDDVVQALVREPGFSVSDFDDEVDGSEWRELKEIFRSKRVSV